MLLENWSKLGIHYVACPWYEPSSTIVFPLLRWRLSHMSATTPWLSAFTELPPRRRNRDSSPTSGPRIIFVTLYIYPNKQLKNPPPTGSVFSLALRNGLGQHLSYFFQIHVQQCCLNYQKEGMAGDYWVVEYWIQCCGTGSFPWACSFFFVLFSRYFRRCESGFSLNGMSC